MLFQSIGLDFLNSSVANGTLLFLSFWPGYLMLRGRLSKSGFAFGSLIPVYLGVGLVALTAFSIVIGTFVISPFVLIILPVASIVVLAITWNGKSTDKQTSLREQKEITRQESKRSKLLAWRINNFTAPVLLVFSFIYWNIAAGIMRWPQPGDVIVHGYYTSLIIFDGHNPTNLEPISSGLAYYPYGMHVLAANFSEMFGLIPGEALLSLAALILVLIPAVVYSLGYLYTRSQVFAIILFFATFYINPKWDLTSFIQGYIYNGPFPNLFAYLICFVILLITVVYDWKKFECVLALIVSESVLLLVYPNFFIIIGVVSAIPLLITLIRVVRSKEIPWTKGQTLAILVTLVILAAVVTEASLPVFLFYSGYLSQYGVLSTAYIATQYPLRDIVTLVAVIGGSTAAIFNLIRRFSGLVYISIVELISNATIFYVAYHNYSIMSVVESERLLPMIFVISIFLMLATVSKTVFNLDERTRIKNFFVRRSFHSSLRFPKIKPVRTITILGIAILFIVILLPSIIQTMNFQLAIKDSAFTTNPYFEADYNTSIWICNNIKPGPLILNEFSWTGYYLPSYCFERVVFNYFPHPQDYDLARLVWFDPQNQSQVRSILTELNVSYIQVTSLAQFFDNQNYGGTGLIDWNGATMNYNSSQIIQLFDQYNFLTKLYQFSSSAVYEVNPTLA
jgi:hypothetical protein